jgi:hypothetical protein
VCDLPGKLFLTQLSLRREEAKMKIAKGAFLVLFFCASIFAQTIQEGQNVFINDEGAIVMAVDASVAVRKLDSPYVMFMLYMGAKEGQSVTVNRNDVILIYQNQEYKMPTDKELGEKYKDRLNDAELYGRTGKESLALSQMRFWKYQRGGDFFPLPNQLAVDEGSMANQLGFRTAVYFKNPGFKKGDKIVIKVKDKNRVDLEGAVAVILE